VTGLDTNVLVRYLAQDDEPQLRQVMALLLKKGARFFVADLVLVETLWVLRSLYDWTDDEVADAYLQLLTIHNLEFEDESRLRSALRAVKRGADLPDELILERCRSSGCLKIASFDKRMAKRYPGFVVVPSS
jgi:predicted nucleic-acid-binding protein